MACVERRWTTGVKDWRHKRKKRVEVKVESANGRTKEGRRIINELGKGRGK